MKHILLLAAVVLVMAALMGVSAFPAFGAANEHASCQGAAHSNQFPPGAAGAFHRKYHGESSKLYATFGPQGQDRHNSGALYPDFEFCAFPD